MLHPFCSRRALIACLLPCLCAAPLGNLESSPSLPSVLLNGSGTIKAAHSLGCSTEELVSFKQSAALPEAAETAAAALWRCLFKVLYHEQSFSGYGSDTSLGKQGTYGEISPAGVDRLLRALAPLLLAPPWHARGFDNEAGSDVAGGDIFYDLGAGVGKVVLQAALAWTDGGLQGAVGVELGSERCAMAGQALQRLRHSLGEVALKSVEFRCGNALETNLNGGTVIFMNSICFPQALLLRLAHRLADLPTGTLVISSARLPGCHQGLALLQRVDLTGTNSTPLLYHVYLVAPRLPAALEYASVKAWELDPAALIVSRALAQEAQSILLESTANAEGSKVATNKSVAEVLGTTPALAGRLRLALVEDSGRDVPTAAALEGALLSRLEGDEGSLVACFAAELRDHVEASTDSAIHQHELESLRRAVTVMDGIRDASEETVMHVAASAGNFHTAQFLLTANAEVDARGTGKGTPLLRAAKALQGGAETTAALLDARADPGASDQWGATALHVASFYGRLPALQMLLEARAPIEARNHEGQSALHRAARGGEAEAVKLLAQARADVCAVDMHNDTPLSVALAKNRQEAAESLRRWAGADCGRDTNRPVGTDVADGAGPARHEEI